MVKKITFDIGQIEALDIPTMCVLSDEEYRAFVRGGELLHVDHHGVLRSYVADYPLAASPRQLDILIEELQRLRAEMERGAS
jgi:hypothetical protein